MKFLNVFTVFEYRLVQGVGLISKSIKNNPLSFFLPE